MFLLRRAPCVCPRWNGEINQIFLNGSPSPLVNKQPLIRYRRTPETESLRSRRVRSLNRLPVEELIRAARGVIRVAGIFRNLQIPGGENEMAGDWLSLVQGQKNLHVLGRQVRSHRRNKVEGHGWQTQPASRRDENVVADFHALVVFCFNSHNSRLACLRNHLADRRLRKSAEERSHILIEREIVMPVGACSRERVGGKRPRRGSDPQFQWTARRLSAELLNLRQKLLESRNG